jgi:hypothetical protein
MNVEIRQEGGGAGKYRPAAAAAMRAPGLTAALPHPLELRYAVDCLLLFDIVNKTWRASAGAGLQCRHPRSKGGEICALVQGIIGWDHPRLHRLGLIEVRA